MQEILYILFQYRLFFTKKMYHLQTNNLKESSSGHDVQNWLRSINLSEEVQDI